MVRSLWDMAECALWGGHTWDWHKTFRHCTTCDKIERFR